MERTRPGAGKELVLSQAEAAPVVGLGFRV